MKLIQTSDPLCYKPLLDITAPAARRLCAIHNIDYVQFVGIKRGSVAWHATFNRIYLISELIESGYRGWAIYLDADAYPFELGFDIRGYLKDNEQWGLIGARGGKEPWNVNAGILLLNLGRPEVVAILEGWKAAFEAQLPDGRLNGLTDWSDQAPDDQSLLHEVLAQRCDISMLLKIEAFDFLGWPHSRFLRQLLRTYGNFEARCQEARSGVSAALLMANFQGR